MFLNPSTYMLKKLFIDFIVYGFFKDTKVLVSDKKNTPIQLLPKLYTENAFADFMKT